jgi:hypothetical protein
MATMTAHTLAFSRRDILLGASMFAGAGPTLAPTHALGKAARGAAGFEFLMGSWRVRHHMLKDRLVGETGWWDFDGTCRCWPLLGGDGNVDDNLLNSPKGGYRAVTLRRCDPKTRQWSIWWLDERSAGLDPPVVGQFQNGVGTFFGDDQLRGRPIRVRFLWSEITERSARWEQAFSPDQGASWEVNWIMHFDREA